VRTTCKTPSRGD
jgi:hypothetical protein